MSDPLALSIRVYKLVIFVGSHLQSAILLIFRLAWGWELIESGWGHLHNVDAMVQNFKDWGVPFPLPNVYISGYTELIGGSLLMLGLASRLIAIPLFFNFCVAYLTASHENVIHFFSNDPAKIIDDSAFPFLITALLIFAFGPGKFSLDGLIAYLLRHKEHTPGFPVEQQPTL